MTGLCDKCDYITDIHFKEKVHGNNIKETYFTCEHCQEHYTCFVTDARVRRMQRQKETLSNSDERLNMQKRINERMDELKGEINV